MLNQLLVIFFIKRLNKEDYTYVKLILMKELSFLKVITSEKNIQTVLPQFKVKVDVHLIMLLLLLVQFQIDSVCYLMIQREELLLIVKLTHHVITNKVLKIVLKEEFL